MSVEKAATAAPAPTAFTELPRATVIGTVAALMLTLLLAALDQTIVGTAMPRIIADLRGFERYAWVATSYMVASTAVVPIVGKLSDLYGRRPFVIGGVVIFMAASVLCGASADMLQLVLFRGLQGVGAGVMMAMCFTVVGDLFPPARRGRVQGLFGSVWGLASVVGPPVGGYLTDNFSWRWVFYVNIPLGFVALGTLLVLFPKIAPPARKISIDFLGAITLLVWVVPLLVALSWGGIQYPWKSVPIVGLGIVVVIGLAAFVYAERRAAEPILPPSLFHNRTVVTTLVMGGLMGAGMFSVILFSPLWVQGVMGASATESGTVLVPMTIGIVSANIISGQIMSRTGRYKALALFGYALIVGGMALLATMDVQTSYGAMSAYMVVVGFGLGTLMPILTVVVQTSVPRTMLGVASGSQQFFRSIGATLGVAMLGSVLVNRFGGYFIQLLPPDLATAIPADRLATLGNPQSLLNPETGASLRDAVAQSGLGASAADTVMATIRQALGVSLHEVFILTTIVVLVGLVVTVFLPEVPLEQGAGTGHKPAPAFEAA